MPAIIDDTYAEAFRSIYVEFLITARDPRWVRACGQRRYGECVEHNSCAIAKRELIDSSDRDGDDSFATPDGRPGAIVQLHVPRFRKDRVEALERAALVRISQNVLTCPTAACFNLIDSETYYRIGRKSRLLRRRIPKADRAISAAGCGGFPRSAASSFSIGGSDTPTGSWAAICGSLARTKMRLWLPPRLA